MGVTYSRLRQLKVDLGFQWQEIVHGAKISNGVISNVNKDKYITLESLEAIVNYLNNKYNKNYEIGDLVEIKKK